MRPRPGADRAVAEENELTFLALFQGRPLVRHAFTLDLADLAVATPKRSIINLREWTSISWSWASTRAKKISLRWVSVSCWSLVFSVMGLPFCSVSNRGVIIIASQGDWQYQVRLVGPKSGPGQVLPGLSVNG